MSQPNTDTLLVTDFIKVVRNGVEMLVRPSGIQEAIVEAPIDTVLTDANNYTDAEVADLALSTTTALALKAPINSPTFTGTVSGVTKAMVGLGNVPNTDTTTTANITDSSDKRFVTNANLITIGNQSGTNTGDNATNTQYSGLAASKQNTLVSGTNIKTINGTTLLGNGDLNVTAGDPTYTPGSFTVATNTYKLLGKGIRMTSSQRITVAGTGRLRINN